MYAQDMRVLSLDKSILSEEYEGFIQHQADQSVSSLLAKKWQIPPQVLKGGGKESLKLQSDRFIKLHENGNILNMKRVINNKTVAEVLNECRLSYAFEECASFEKEIETLIRQYDELLYGPTQVKGGRKRKVEDMVENSIDPLQSIEATEVCTICNPVTAVSAYWRLDDASKRSHAEYEYFFGNGSAGVNAPYIVFYEHVEDVHVAMEYRRKRSCLQRTTQKQKIFTVMTRLTSTLSD